MNEMNEMETKRTKSYFWKYKENWQILNEISQVKERGKSS